MNKSLSLTEGHGFTLPLDAVTQTFGILACKLRMRWLRVPAAITSITSVIRLLNRSRPATILWRVWTVIVNTVNRVIWRRTQPHVSQKSLKAIKPTRADCNATFTILKIIRAFRIKTTSFNPTPRFIFTGLSQPMFSICISRSLALKTPTSEDFFTKVVLADIGNGAAVTTASPETVSVGRSWQFFDHHKPSKSMAGQVGCTFESLLESFHEVIISQNRGMVGI